MFALVSMNMNECGEQRTRFPFFMPFAGCLKNIFFLFVPFLGICSSASLFVCIEMEMKLDTITQFTSS